MIDPWLAVPIGTAALAYLTGGLDWMSSVTGGVIGYMVLFKGGWKWLLILLLFFFLSTAATKYEYSIKKEYKVSQKRRTVENVLGNGLVPLIFAVQGNLIGFTSSLAVATADTLSSEIGVLSNNEPVSVLDFTTKMKRGENGGVSSLGHAAMFFGSGSIALACLGLFGDWGLFWITLWAGVFGCTVDSVLGATLENEGIVGNHLVNFLATLAGGMGAVALASII